jgi:DNA-binding PadR family transcriptional regulator
MTVEEAEFTFLKEKTEASPGNLSLQLSKLKEGGYIEINKKFRNNYPLTLCRITPAGKKKFSEYVKALKEYINPGENQ